MLDTKRWAIDTGTAPGNIGGVNSGTFSSSNVDLSNGMLALKLTQTGSGPVVSTGAEVRSVSQYGYGTFSWVMRASSTATTPNGVGSVTSGQISSGFTLSDATSKSEIDVEIEGQFPNTIELTTWHNGVRVGSSTFTLSNPDQAFHTYVINWQPSAITFSVDGAVVATHTSNLPTAPVWIMMNHWGTNSTSFGGNATVGTTRWLYFSNVSYTSCCSN